MLGEPESSVRRKVGDLECDALLWPLPLWPDLRFEVMTGPGGAVWNEWLVRAPGSAGPEPRTAADLRPWSCTVDEVARAFAPVRPMEGSAPTRWALAFTDPAAWEALRRGVHLGAVPATAAGLRLTSVAPSARGPSYGPLSARLPRHGLTMQGGPAAAGARRQRSRETLP